MSGEKGRDVLIKLDDGTGAFVTVAGIRTTRFTCTASGVDGTSADSPDAWRELIAGAGTRSVQVQGSGVFKNASSDARLRSLFFGSESTVFELIVPAFGTLIGAFQITNLTYSGRYDGEAQFSLTLESAGAIAFEALST